MAARKGPGAAAELHTSPDELMQVLDRARTLLLFGIGSVAGMALLSVAISLPFNFSNNRIERSVGYLQLGIGLGTSGLGGFTVFNYFIS